MPTRLLIVGGVAGGATAAARARRLSEEAEIIVFERGEFVSLANCGLPYYIGGEIKRRAALLVQTSAGLSARFALDIRTRHEVVGLDRAARTVRVRALDDGREYDELYDFLLLSPGAEPLRPPLPGRDHPRIFTLRNLPDTDCIKSAVDAGAQSALVVGGGFIGLEMAENLRRRGLAVTLVELLPQVLPTLDAEMAAPLHDELTRQGVRLHLGTAVESFADQDGRVRAALRSGETVDADLVVLAVGVRPETRLAQEAGLTVDERGALVVDEHMRTSDPHIYAVGDAVAVQDAVLGGPTRIPLAGPANRQARIAVDHIFGRPARYRGSQGTAVLRLFGLTAASTGANERTLRQRGVAYRKIYLSPAQHVGYYPGAQPMQIKLLFAPTDGRVFGAQIVGGEGVDKRIDVLSVALQAGFTVYDLEEVELAYAPQFGAAKDPINLAGFIAANVLRGDMALVHAEALDDADRAGWTLLDVRDEAEFLAWHVPGAVQIPLAQLRDRWTEIPQDKPVAVYCATGQRSYYACRILRQRGVACHNMSGGVKVFRYVHPEKPGAVAPPPLTRETCG